jgi:hypothetical protein
MDYNLATFISTLNIKVTKPIDIGEYKVVAENIAGRAETTCTLFVEAVPNIDETPYVNPDSFRPFEDQLGRGQPSYPEDDTDDGSDGQQPALILKPLEDRECFEGETVTFVAEVTGRPRPSLTWLKDGRPLEAAQRFFFNYLIHEAKVVFIISNVKKEDESKYTLFAKNSFGEASTSAKLRVKLVPTIDDTSYVNPDVFQQFELKKRPGQAPDELNYDDNQYKKPYFVKVPKNIEVCEGSPVKLDCVVFGRPTPLLTWYLNGRELLPDATHKVRIIKNQVIERRKIYFEVIIRVKKFNSMTFLI